MSCALWGTMAVATSCDPPARGSAGGGMRSRRSATLPAGGGRCVNDCDSGAAATGKMPVVPVRCQDGDFPG